MSDIFLSYASQDRERMRLLAEALEAEGWSVFWDRDIPTGGAWHDVLGLELDACGCVVVVWTEASVHSRWVYEEAEEGKKKKALFPVKFDAIPPPLGFRMFQAVDLAQWAGERDHPAFLQLVGDIRVHFKAKGRPAPVASPPVVPSPPAPVETALDASILEKARYQLACHLGPIARILVRKASKKAKTQQQLITLLAAELEDDKQRADFIRRMKS
jgi:hypothetical protein